MVSVGSTVASEHLPDDEEQDWVVDQLRVLVSRCGRERLLEAPLLEPSPAYFPDPWSPDILGAIGILRRLMDYAGLGDLAVDASVLAPSDSEFLDRDGFKAVACFFGIRDGTRGTSAHWSSSRTSTPP